MRHRSRQLAAACTSVWLLVAGAPLLAHHSAAAEYDQDRTVTVQGIVTKIEWTNPHIFIYLDAKDENGQVVTWSLEGASPIALFRDGVHKDSLKIGDAITVVAFPARTVAHLGDMKTIMRADGTKLMDRSGKQ